MEDGYRAGRIPEHIVQPEERELVSSFLIKFDARNLLIGR